MNGINFGKKHSYDDWGLVLTNKSLGLPTPKTSSVSIDGADGVIDTSEVLCGEIKFSNRTLEFEFTMTTDYEDFNELVTEISNYLHGKKLKIVLDEDSNYYYYGRCQINQWTSDRRIGKIVIKCDCDPFKYTKEKCISTAHIDGVTYVKVYGKRMTVNPTIEVDTDNVDVVVKYPKLLQSRTIQLHKNKTNLIPDLFLYEGVNTLIFIGSGNVKIIYQGGEL